MSNTKDKCAFMIAWNESLRRSQGNYSPCVCPCLQSDSVHRIFRRVYIRLYEGEREIDFICLGCSGSTAQFQCKRMLNSIHSNECPPPNEVL